MNVREDLPYEVDIVDHTWITMSDGVRLSAKLWLPRTDGPVPVLLEYLPYRKDDFTYERDSAQHGYFAGHGYATARVDIRGTGDSEGILEDEYLQLELDDGVAVIEWLASQDWCSGSVGMFGISWGGFNSLQVAALAPPALKAVIAVAATDDRYATDVHYHGGALLACEMLPWAGLPPRSDAVVGPLAARRRHRDRRRGAGSYLGARLGRSRHSAHVPPRPMAHGAQLATARSARHGTAAVARRRRPGDRSPGGG